MDKRYVIDHSRVDISPILPFLTNRKWLKLIQNAKFEQRFFQYYHKTHIKGVFDTYLAENIITSTTYNNGLGALALKYANITLDKGNQKSFITMKPMEMFSDEQLGYAAKDVEILFPIYEAQNKILIEEKLDKVADLEFELAGIVAGMENEGIPVNVPKWRQLIEEYKVKHENSRTKMNQLFFDGIEREEQLGMFVRDSINLNSPKQVKNAFSYLGIDLDATNEREISLLDHPAADELLEYRKFQKILTSYGESFLEKIHPFTNRIHADFQQIGTETGRFACKSPNLQQIPEEFRECISLDDYKLVGGDYSQIELRVLAEYSNDPIFIQAFQSGEDLHKATASIMFNIPIDKVTKEQRFTAKTLNFGITYGMGSKKLMDMLNKEARKNNQKELTLRAVQVILNRYKETYRKATDWLQFTGAMAYRNGFSETMLGRKRYFTRPTSGDENSFDAQIGAIKRQGANSPIQGTSADITKLAMLNLYNDLNTYNFKAKIIIQVHDEIVVLAHKRHATAVKEVLEESMLNSAQEVLKKVPVKVDSFVSDIWHKGE